MIVGCRRARYIQSVQIARKSVVNNESSTEKSCAGNMRVVRRNGDVGRLAGPRRLVSGLRRERQSLGGTIGGTLSPMRGQRQAQRYQLVSDMRRDGLVACLCSGIDEARLRLC